MWSGCIGSTAGAIRSNSNTGNTMVNAWQSYLTSSNGQSSYDVNIYINSRPAVPAQTLMGAMRNVDNPELGTLVMMSAELALIAFRFRRKN